MSIWYGAHVADDNDLRLCGDVSGKRVIELGIAATPNSVEMARRGAKAIAVDADAAAITSLRAAAEQAEVSVGCHQTNLAELGFATSASVDLVIASHTLDDSDDLARLLRQVHRVLKPGASFVVAMRHPVAAMIGPERSLQHAYGAAGPTISTMYMAFERSNFHLDQLHELNDRRVREPVAPSVLVMRTRKQGV